jgi:glycosyltransferase involved in cell wall biosynthesis
MKSIVVHTEKCKEILKGLGHNQKIFVVPHGCVEYDNVGELYNIFQNPYTVIQFGFGFQYKGVDMAIDAINHLKKTDPKFKDIFYCYLLSSSGYFNNVHNNYLKFLNDKINQLSLHDNIAIVQGYHSDNVINSYLRTAKIAIFPYIADKKHRVYGASGAIRIAMANNIPVIASSACNQFDDLEGVLPRPANYLEIAKEIDEIFSNNNYKKDILKKQKKYIRENNWNVGATRYLSLYRELLK